jgi:hypothetical protein
MFSNEDGPLFDDTPTFVELKKRDRIVSGQITATENPLYDSVSSSNRDSYIA